MKYIIICMHTSHQICMHGLISIYRGLRLHEVNLNESDSFP